MKNKMIKTAGAVILLVLLLSVFFSRTIYNFRLPVVTATAPKNGRLSKSETVTGITEWADSLALYAPLSGKVSEVLAREGEAVSQSQPLFAMEYDADEIRQKLEENDISFRKLALELENIRLQAQKLNRSIAELSAEEYRADPVSRYELETTEAEIVQAEEHYAALSALLSTGVVTRQEVTQASASLAALRAKREELAAKWEEQTEKNAEAAADQETNRQKQLRDYRYELDLLTQNEKAKLLEQENLALQRETNEKALADFESYGLITAPEDGILLSMEVSRGQYINEKQMTVVLGLGMDFQIECDVSLSNNFIALGDECLISNTSHHFDATVTKITPTENAKRVTVSFSGAAVSAGETFDVTFKKESAESYTLVPSAAVNMDSNGYFLYQIKRRDGLLGKEFYAVKQRVYIGDSDNEYTVIVSGVTFFEPVALLADQYFEENETIRLANEGDFFEN